MELYTLRPVSGSLTDIDIPRVWCVNVPGIYYVKITKQLLAKTIYDLRLL